MRNPNGIVLITPESIEAMFVNAPYNVNKLFCNLKYIVVDEIHSFLGVDRGIQLMSLISRIQSESNKRILIIGLSATIGKDNYLEVKKITGNSDYTKVLVDTAKKETDANFKFFEIKTKEFSLDFIKDLYLETLDKKALVFPNSRAKTEEIAVKLNRISKKLNGHSNYFSHHSSVDKEIREGIEHFAKNNERFNFCISCTSTLELGIDIGSVDKIIQIDSTHSVSSLVQRIGRSGRKEGEKSNVTIYATNEWSFLQALACWRLYQNDFLEPLTISQKPYDLLLHQLLSLVKQKSGLNKSTIIGKIKNNPAFASVEELDISKILEHSIKEDYLEEIQREVILGLEGEKIVNSREFYSVFRTEEDFKVISSGPKIGQLPFSPQIKLNENILLAAKMWKIIDIDFDGKKIEVIPAKDGKSPIFSGAGGEVHPEIRKEMLRILKSGEQYSELDEISKSILARQRFDFKNFKIENFEYDRPVIAKGNKIIWYTFTGTRINRSIKYILQQFDVEVIDNESNSTLELGINSQDLKKLLKSPDLKNLDLDISLEEKLNENEAFLNFSKWGLFLPMQYKIEILKERYFDFPGACIMMDEVKFRELA